MSYLSNVVFTVFCILKSWSKKGTLCLCNLIILNMKWLHGSCKGRVSWMAVLYCDTIYMQHRNVVYVTVNIEKCGAVAILCWYHSNVHIETWLLMCYYVRW